MTGILLYIFLCVLFVSFHAISQDNADLTVQCEIFLKVLVQILAPNLFKILSFLMYLSQH